MGCPTTTPLMDVSINLTSSQALVAKDKEASTNLSLNLSVCLHIHSTAPQAPLNWSGTPFPIVS